jgi:ferredoxin
VVDVGDDAVIDRYGFDVLIEVIRGRGLRTVGPVVRDGAIVHGEIGTTSDLPEGWHDHAEPGKYRLTHDGSSELFGWAVGPASWKSEFFVPAETVWRAAVAEGEVALSEPREEPVPVAVIGARPCEVAALGTLDRVLRDGAVPDDRYAARRDGAFIVAVECGTPSSTCFCTSMGTGPGAGVVYDLALTELAGPVDGERTYYVRVGSVAGAETLAQVPHMAADDTVRSGRRAVVDGASERMGRSLDTEDLPGLLARNLEHPRWGEVAERCLSCGNCTLVCPTCFCSDVKDITDVSGTVERQRRWASCFDLEHSYLHGGSVRPTTYSRYRQWMTHKLSTWWDQFDESGCVGCGRCIAWCPVGIDITEEAAAIRATDGASVIDTINQMVRES